MAFHMAFNFVAGISHCILQKVSNETYSLDHKFQQPLLQLQLIFGGIIIFSLIFELKSRLFDKQNFIPDNFMIKYQGLKCAAVIQQVKNSMHYYIITLIDASIYSMLKNSIIVFQMLLAFFYLKNNLNSYNYLGSSLILIGCIILGLSNSYQSLSTQYQSLIIMLFTQFIGSLQFAIEEKAMKRDNLDPFLVTFYMAIIGFFMNAVMIVVFQVSGQGVDSLFGIQQMMASKEVCFQCLMIVLLFIALAWSSVAITKYTTALARVTISMARSAFIWGFFIYADVPGKEVFEWSHFCGFLLVVVGTVVYNRMWVNFQ